jgi:hypothetical protein
VSDGQEPARDGFEEDIARALRRGAAEARPRGEFRDALRERIADGTLAPSIPEAPGAPARVPEPPVPRPLTLSRWIVYPAAAAILAAAFALSGALEPRAPVDAPVPFPEKVGTAEAAMAAAERRAAGFPVLAGRPWQHRVIDGRPWLLPAEAAFAEGKELRNLGSFMAAAEKGLEKALPEITARPASPVVTLVAEDRAAFEALVAPHFEPFPLGELTIAYAVPDPGVLLLSPEALAPGGPPCEPIYIHHAAVHAWLQARCAGKARTPLWADKGIAGVAAQGSPETRSWCRQVLTDARSQKLDPFSAAEVLSQADFGAMVRLVATRAPRSEEPFSLVPVFYAHAESLVLFLTDEEDGPSRRGAFVKWLQSALDGTVTDPAATARALGFADPAALFAARDRWLGL